MMDTNSTQYYLGSKWNFQHFAKNFLSFPIPWDLSRFQQKSSSNSIMPIKQLTSVCHVFEVSRTCVKSKVKHQLVLPPSAGRAKTNDKLQSMLRRSPRQYLSVDCNGDVERQAETKMYFARDPISAKNLVSPVHGGYCYQCYQCWHQVQVQVTAACKDAICQPCVPGHWLMDRSRQMGKLGCNVHVIIIITIIIITLIFCTFYSPVLINFVWLRTSQSAEIFWLC